MQGLQPCTLWLIPELAPGNQLLGSLRGFRVSGCTVQGLGVRVQGLGVRVSGFRLYGSRFRG